MIRSTGLVTNMVAIHFDYQIVLSAFMFSNEPMNVSIITTHSLFSVANYKIWRV